MLLGASYKIFPLDRRLSVGQGAVGVGVSIGHRQYSQHSLKVTHLLSPALGLLQQCSPSGLKCVGPRCRATAVLTTPVMISPSPTAAVLGLFGLPTGTLVPSGPCHTIPLGSEV